MDTHGLLSLSPSSASVVSHSQKPVLQLTSTRPLCSIYYPSGTVFYPSRNPDTRYREQLAGDEHRRTCPCLTTKDPHVILQLTTQVLCNPGANVILTSKQSTAVAASCKLNSSLLFIISAIWICLFRHL